MNANAAIGAKVKELRTQKKHTLKQLSEASGLSIGFLSQFERGISSIALDSLEKVAQVLEVPLSVLFEESGGLLSKDPVVHGVDLQPSKVSNQIYQYLLKRPEEEFTMLPRLFVLMPFENQEELPEMYTHDGEEFVYVLEGVVTFFLEAESYVLYPGDSIHIHSRQRHNWMNRTTRIARLLTVNTPNPLPPAGSEDTAEDA
ncbi:MULTISPECIES: helix-turn-helix domain-containing protein [Caproicibacterium]|uniref:XRE family transcriptional regulator n=1 Tax=Caproicibacterium argilliputei TaxID=3030016 RepID=A0AA97D9Y1_9FIRM|nr:XRE family transcriptional regulator [Caproicibacterium argilliputei]WOC32959.1 XRE family transcriptional regulator [Caproicibacterium argilliputei]